MKTKTGEKITTQEFFSRWKTGIQKVTQLQQVKISLIGNIIMLMGILLGLGIMISTRVWWLFIILLGSLFLITVGFIGTLQRYWVLKKVDEMMKGGLSENGVNN